MVRSIRSNPLALTVLCLLAERPMHPYEIAQTLRDRHKHESIRLNYGSLYGVVKSLDRQELIRALETERQGRRPQRTVYELTDAGRLVMDNWLEELIAVPTKEYLQFEAALALLGVVGPDRAVELLRRRCTALDAKIEALDEMLADCERMGLLRLFVVESEYQRELLRAELRWVRQLIDDIETGRLQGVDQWRRWHAGERTAFDELLPAELRQAGQADQADQADRSEPSDPSDGQES
jgi:DNA-binding PadR family transcriptional regulator